MHCPIAECEQEVKQQICKNLLYKTNQTGYCTEFVVVLRTVFLSIHAQPNARVSNVSFCRYRTSSEI